MERDIEHVRPLPEDGLAAVAVVDIDIEDGHRRGRALGQPVRGDGGVVQVAVAAEHIAGRMVAGWPAEPVGDRHTVEHAGRGRDRDIDRRPGGLPGAGDDGRGRVEGPVADPATGRLGLRPGIACRPQPRVANRVGHDAVAAGAADTPRVPGRLQILNEAVVVHRQDRFEPEVVGRLDLEAPVCLEGAQDRCRPGTDLEGWHLAPATDLARRLMEGVAWARDDDHRWSSRAVDSRP